MRTPVLSVARLAVDVVVGTVTRNDRVQNFRAVMTLVALAMPIATLGDHQLSSKDHTPATRTSSAWFRLDLGRIDDSRFGRQSTEIDHH